jgi:hypothetical protein
MTSCSKATAIPCSAATHSPPFLFAKRSHFSQLYTFGNAQSVMPGARNSSAFSRQTHQDSPDPSLQCKQAEQEELHLDGHGSVICAIRRQDRDLAGRDLLWGGFLALPLQSAEPGDVVGCKHQCRQPACLHFRLLPQVSVASVHTQGRLRRAQTGIGQAG